MAQDTLPKLLKGAFEKYGDQKVAMRKKRLGIWNEYTWKDYYENVRLMSLGLAALGFESGDRIAIIGDNDPEWFWLELAAMAIGGMALGIYTDSVVEETKYILEHSGAKFVGAKDQEQVDKVLELKPSLPDLKKVIYWEPKGLTQYDDPDLLSMDKLEQLGETYGMDHPGFFEESIEKGTINDIPIICYTSGTSSLPKGVLMSYGTMINMFSALNYYAGWRDTDVYVSYISPAWSTEQLFGIAGSLISRAIVNFPEEPETVNEDIREIGPQIMLYSSRLWESVVSTIQAKMMDAGKLNRFIYNLAFKIGGRVSKLKQNGQRVNLLWRIANKFSDWAIFRPLRDSFGLARIRHAYTAGAPLNPDFFEFLRIMGLNLKQGYGLTEGGILSQHRDDDVRYETVGSVVPFMEVRVLDSGEMVTRSAGLSAGYYKDPEKTRAAFLGSWFCTGDATYIDEAGHVIFWDRVSDLMELAGGVKYPPQYIEGKLKFSPYVKDIMVIGGKERPFISALVNIDFDNVGKWAESKRIPYTTFVDLSQKVKVSELVLEDVRRVNLTLPEAVRVKRVVLLHKEFDPDEAELTRSRKLRRGFMETKYGDLLNAVYAGDTEFEVDTQITYQDGSTGRMLTTLRINSSE